MYQCSVCAERSNSVGFKKGNLIMPFDKKAGPAATGSFVDPLSLLPLPVHHIGKFPVGNTPLVNPIHLRTEYNMSRLYLKYDGLNPSGSLKDRASLLVGELALHLGEKRIVLASTGNAGSAMACAGAAYGLEVILLVPASAPKAKLLQSILYGARVAPVEGTYDDAFDISIQLTEEFGGINRNTAFNPFTTEGKKTVSVEIYNQLFFKVPDYVYIAAGDGVIYAGVYKGFADLLRCGAADRIPRIIMVQAAGSNAIVQSLRTGSEVILKSTETKADSISVCSPANGEMAIRYLDDCRGWAVEVDDTDIREAQRELAEKAGVFTEPSAAAAWAGCKLDRDKLDPDAVVVVLLTGTGFKDLVAVESIAKIPPSCKPDVDHVIGYLKL